MAAGEPMLGLLLAQQDHPARMIIDELIAVWFASEAEEWVGQVRYLPI